MYKRFVAAQLKAALADTRVVLMSGPRQSGKTTLARELAEDGMTFFTLDNATTLEAARRDVVGFVRGIDRAVIDEVQRLPELLLAIKESVDTDRRPGRFLLTGSANLMTLPRVADSLAGRTTTVQLLPLAQAEIRSRPSDFLFRVFQGKPPAMGQRVVAEDLVSAVLAGGYPEALERRAWNRRQLWYRDYIDSIIQRDVRDIAEIDRIKDMSRLLRVLAHRSGQLVNYSGFGAPLNVSHTTVRKYVAVFETIFLARTLDPWYSNELSRLVKTPKLFFLDSGLLAALRNIPPQRVAADRGSFGPLLETFVLGELLKLASWYGEPLDFFHFRDKEKNEVDIVMEDADRRVVGIEVKAAATATANDFKGLAKLQQACGKRFVLGMVLYDHHQTVPFSEKLLAVPISALWA